MFIVLNVHFEMLIYGLIKILYITIYYSILKMWLPLPKMRYPTPDKPKRLQCFTPAYFKCYRISYNGIKMFYLFSCYLAILIMLMYFDSLKTNQRLQLHFYQINVINQLIKRTNPPSPCPKVSPLPHPPPYDMAVDMCKLTKRTLTRCTVAGFNGGL